MRERIVEIQREQIVKQLFTCYGENFEIPHAANVLEAKVSDLRTPAEEEGVESQHGGDVAHADVTYVDTPETEDTDDEKDSINETEDTDDEYLNNTFSKTGIETLLADGDKN